MLLYIEKHTHTSMSIGTHWIRLEILIPFLKIFPYPDQSTYYFCGLFGSTGIDDITEIRSGNFDKSLKVHILQEPATGN